MAKEKKRGNEYQITLVCVNSYTDGVPAGYFSNPHCGGRAFQNLTQLLLGMEEMFDEIGFPQASTSPRIFAEPGTVPVKPVEEYAQRGAVATFVLRIHFRMNASWQGSVRWLEGDKDENFRSVLELVRLLDSALRT